MKQYLIYLILSGVWLLAAVVNIVDDRPAAVVGLNVFTAVLFAALAGGYAFLSGRYGETGKWKLWLHLSALLLLAAALAVVLLVS